jgi:glycosyltransferase involved in cell wall biosynthesis
MNAASADDRAAVLYLAPWVDIGGTDKGTIDWFRWIDRDRFTPSLITTQPSPNRRLAEIEPYAEELWPLPELVTAEEMPATILDILQSRRVRVLHIMNSRLGFQLLPDLAFLPDPPAVVVQLHVEEEDRAGYVRYVTTRYGNLVDRFSVTSEHLAEAVRGYGIPETKIRVIYTGVDAEEEFSPNFAEPAPGLDEDRFQILYPARLTAQKDPFLMVEVAEALRRRKLPFHLHVLGEGDLEAEVRQLVSARGLDAQISFHPATPSPQRWYSACDAVLLTSLFEGVPYVAFESMAMGVPIVAPELPGNRELLGARYELIDPRDSSEAYADRLMRLRDDKPERVALGEAMRRRVRDRFTLKRMAGQHEKLYEELLGPESRRRRDPGNRGPLREGPEAEPLRFLDRPLTGTPLVSVLVPHFNQLSVLGECVDSIRAQSHTAVELIVVDDCSTEPGVAEFLSALEAAEATTVVRLSRNEGPARARNAGLPHCNGRYVLPVDADNMLLADAVELLVEQLGTSGEEIGFIYPNLQYFGNREDYFEAPEYNLYHLLYSNYCDTCSLFDRSVFDSGIRYPEDHDGHEDWALVLMMAARGIRGEPANMPTVRYRKWGFNRSDCIEHTTDRRDKLISGIAAQLGLDGRIKAKEDPALSLVPLDSIDLSEDGEALASGLERQTCDDLELIARFDGSWPGRQAVPVVRRIPSRLSQQPGEALRQGLSLARGRFVAVTAGTATPLLCDPSFAEKILRRFTTSEGELDAIALVDDGEEGRFALQPLPELSGEPHTVVWRELAQSALPRGLHADLQAPVPSLARLFCGAGMNVEWRYLRSPDHRPQGGREGSRDLLPEPSHPVPTGASHRRLPAVDRPLLPGERAYRVPRLQETGPWRPPLTHLTYRCREVHGERRIITSGSMPDGFVPEWNLGALLDSGPEGTARLVRIDDRYRVLSRGGWREVAGEAETIGYLETVWLPQLGAIVLAVHRETGQETIVTVPGDPLLPHVDLVETLGFVEPAPPQRREVPRTDFSHGMVGLVKALDRRAGRHRYEIGSAPAGELVGELGALAESERQGSIAAWIVGGFLVTERHRPRRQKPQPASALRWIAEPLTGRGTVSRGTWTRAIAERSFASVAQFTHRPPGLHAPAGEPDGWLFDSFRPGRVPLYAGYHPVTGDQLLTRSDIEVLKMGYAQPELIGFLRPTAPVTGSGDQLRRQIPWARRFGLHP